MPISQPLQPPPQPEPPQPEPAPHASDDGVAVTGPTASAPETQRHRRDYLLRLPEDDFHRLRRVAVALQLEDDREKVIREARSVHLEIENPESLAEVLFQLNLALRSDE